MLTKRAHTLVEVLVVSVITVILFASAVGVFVVSRTMYLTGLTAQGLQRDVDWMMNRIIKGLEESGTRYGLRSASSFTIPDITEVDFTGMDGYTRKYYMASNGTIYYEDPTQTPTTSTVYSPQSGATVVLRFWEPSGYLDNETVAIYLAVTKTVSGRTASGSLTTYVNLRNVSK